MNLDRPLDDLVKETLAAKRAQRADTRKAARQKRVESRASGAPSAPSSGRAKPEPAVASMDVDTKKNDRLGVRRRGAIAKKRRPRKPAALGDMEIDTRRKPAPTHNLVSSAYARKAVKVVVSNLHPQVTQTDIAELFETVGPLKSATLSRYPNGASACEAEVVFENMPDALDAIKRYNMVPLDNQPLQITLVTTRTGKARRAPAQKKPAMQLDEPYRSPQHDKQNGFDDNNNSPDRPADRGADRAPDRAPQRRRQGARRRKFNNRPDDRRQDDRRPEDREERHSDDRQDRGRGMYVD